MDYDIHQLRFPSKKFLTSNRLYFFVKSDGERTENFYTILLSELGPNGWGTRIDTDDIQQGIDSVLREYKNFKAES